jgi:hypothetical protein
MATARHTKRATDFWDSVFLVRIFLFSHTCLTAEGGWMDDVADGLAMGNWELMYYWSIRSLRETAIGF